MLFAFRGEDTLPEEVTHARTSPGAHLLLRKYDESMSVNAPGSVKVCPKLDFAEGYRSQDMVSFTVGETRQYIVTAISTRIPGRPTDFPMTLG